jgi:glycosyltransferase involved in cell wall biosynthesis
VSKDEAPEIWLSILVPVYNVEAHLQQCVLSIMSQIDDGVEVILLDDLSTDNSLALAERLAREFPQIRVLNHLHNQGPSAARNNLLEAAQGTYVWFVDSDDYLYPGAIGALRQVVTRHAPDLVLCDYKKHRLFRTKAFYGPAKRLAHDPRALVRGVFKSRKMYIWLKIAKREIWGTDIRFPVGKVFEDISTMPLLLLRANSYFYVPKPWLFYRAHVSSIMGGIKRIPGFFDEAKHQDLASALSGFKEKLQSRLGASYRSVDYAIADFCAKEFTKTGVRLVKARRNTDATGSISPILHNALRELENSSPLPMHELQVEYAKRLRFGRLLALRYFMRRSQSPTAVHAVPVGL